MKKILTGLSLIFLLSSSSVLAQDLSETKAACMLALSEAVAAGYEVEYADMGYLKGGQAGQYVSTRRAHVTYADVATTFDRETDIDIYIYDENRHPSIKLKSS